MAERTAKLTLKVGDKEIRYEAGVDRVEAELHRLAAELLRSTGSDQPAVLSVSALRPDGAEIRPGSIVSAEKVAPASTAAAELMRHVSLDRRQVATLYTAGTSGGIALRSAPDTGRDSHADALLLLLYGMLALKGRAPVTAPALMKAVRDSGLPIPRPSRALKGKSRLFVASGERRSTRYRLTDDGVEHCERLIASQEALS